MSEARPGDAGRGGAASASGEPQGLVLANLDLEEELRAAFGAAGGPRRSLSAPARRAAAAAGSLLRVLCRPGDRLWLPAPLDPERLPELPGLPRPVLEHGAPEGLAPAAALLAWGEGPRAAGLRERWGIGPSAGGDEPPGAVDGPLHEALWRLPPASPEVVARVGHRSFALELAEALGGSLPGARMVADPGALEAHLAAGDRRSGLAASSGRWVVKAPYSAAGRERFRGTDSGELRRPEVRRRLEGLFERHGALLFEPWVERSADFGCAGLLGRGASRLASRHRLEIDRRGAFRAIVVPAPAAEEPARALDPDAVGLRPEEARLLDRAFEAVAARLRAAGYTGPFGLDAFRWRRPDGSEAFRPLAEINPRITFGLVARGLADRLASGVPPAAAPIRLDLGGPPPPGSLTLLEPGEDGSPGAWLSGAARR